MNEERCIQCDSTNIKGGFDLDKEFWYICEECGYSWMRVNDKRSEAK